MVEVEGEEALGRMVVPEGPDSSLCLAAGADQDCGAPAELLLSGLGRLGTVGQGEHLAVARREVAQQESQEPLGESVVQNQMGLSQHRHLWVVQTPRGCSASSSWHLFPCKSLSSALNCRAPAMPDLAVFASLPSASVVTPLRVGYFFNSLCSEQWSPGYLHLEFASWI